MTVGESFTGFGRKYNTHLSIPIDRIVQPIHRIQTIGSLAQIQL